MADLPGSTLATTTVAVATPTSANTAPTFIFQPVGEMFTCGMTMVRWGYVGASAQLSLNISNINVSQQAPLPVSTASSIIPQPGAKRQYNGYGNSYLPAINVLIASKLDPSSASWTWPSVTVPQGWYQMLANVQDVVQSTSSPFFVMNGTNTNCIPQYDVSSSSTNVPVSPSPSPSAVSAASSGHSHTGAIAGGIIGGIAFFAAAFAALLYCFLRRRYQYPRSRSEGDGNVHRWSLPVGMGNSRHSSYARTSLQKAHAALPTLEADQTFLASDEEVSTVEHEKAVAAGYPMPAHPHPHSQSNRGSTQTNGSYGRASNPELPARQGSHNAGTGEVILLERANTFSSTRRKPAPRYDGPDETGVKGNGTSSSRTTLESIRGNTNARGNGNMGGTHVLQHQSSFGAMRPMHVMIPDPPPPAHS
ncbi:hypothetical protein BJV78DRAFT_205785 [Lactifluus subvellereus]|nr:hypothetical protein BJV78DRAFT_205785 [Lactifluus subvellereus]